MLLFRWILTLGKRNSNDLHSRPLHSRFVCSIPAKVQVYIDSEGTIWDVALNQTNISNNNNKFYFIQLVQLTSEPDRFACFTRWGRVGDRGDTRLTDWSDFDRQVYESSGTTVFESKFKTKTKNSWSARGDFQTYAGKYTMLDRDYGEDDADKDDKADGNTGDTSIPECKLEPKIQELVEMIFDREMMEQQLKALNFNANKMPLGKLRKSTITDGYNALKELADVLAVENGAVVNRREIERLSNKFYTVIPHDFGRSIPPLINSQALLKQKLELVESLSEIQATQSLWESPSAPRDSNGNLIHPVDGFYNSLNLNHLVPLDHHAADFEMVKKYVRNTHGDTHDAYALEVMDVFELERATEPERWLAAGCDKMSNRKLLWHGSRLTNFVGILSQGLRIAPPEAPVTGYMFGKGVYFADCVSKSANYCYTDRNYREALMLLCEVALGDMLPLYQASYEADKEVQDANKNSTLGMGRMEPNPAETVTTPEGLEIPFGKVGVREDKKARNRCSLLYNEYIVYNTAQIKFRYLIKMKFNYHRS
ncbi:PARP-domain-containing protein [Basidiobolus meristosporus CBS 931.73]|uniref:Poly [ADP-ribose] polymerase n=1 Tax=Basidiobolus meristosporus CBS 931.73 TaxID=1314790 RepID=A0A1Y1ZB10_9FUNG|nr:PARP-domain-containing protein [Basidiobolus meristosporus CBS 931.73]|eukprot:ORY06965.1 PARP-domain-containing protein [Basidiobolus meristosporus CBS 931.73]